MIVDSTAQSFAPILLLIAIAIFMSVSAVIMAHTVGPKRKGPIKDSVYESGMPPIADARRRFNVRFYLIAVLFLVFDVEVVFLWPWAVVFHQAAVSGEPIGAAGVMVGKGFLLAAMSVFLILLLVGYIYDWRKGLFRWD